MMADSTTITGADNRVPEGTDSRNGQPEKRKSTESSGDASPQKKISISMTSSKPVPLVNQKISFNLASSGEPTHSVVLSDKKAKPVTSGPIKLSLGSTQKSKEPPKTAVFQKSAAAAKVFDNSDDSEEEEMPPEAKMRMKNIGRDTPTASGPNSYGKGKQGFIDRQKIIEKQLKEEMEKVSGDKKDEEN